MKIRTGFVSNSSSSSFCIMGVRIEEDELLALYNKNHHNEPYQEDDIYYGDVAESLLKGTSLGYDRINEGDDFTIGIPICDMLDDETKNQFKERVKTALLTININEEPSIIIDGGFN